MKYLQILLLGVFTVSGLTVFSNTAHAIKCEKVKPSYSFKTSTARTEYIRTESAASLTDMHDSQSGGTVGGLGGGETGFKVETEFSYITDRKAACVHLKHIKLTFYAKPTIHIASNFRRGSCEYSAVFAHEKKHVREVQKFVREFGPKMKNKLAREILPSTQTQYGPIDADKVENAQEKIQEDIFTALEEYQQEIMPILAERQQAIDSPEEYARVDSKCNGWNEVLFEESEE